MDEYKEPTKRELIEHAERILMYCLNADSCEGCPFHGDNEKCEVQEPCAMWEPTSWDRAEDGPLSWDSVIS